MKNVLIAFVLALATTSVSSPQETWPVESAEQREREWITQQILAIRGYYERLGGSGGGNQRGAIRQFLKLVGKPMSYKIYQEMQAASQL